MTCEFEAEVAVPLWAGDRAPDTMSGRLELVSPRGRVHGHDSDPALTGVAELLLHSALAGLAELLHSPDSCSSRHRDWKCIFGTASDSAITYKILFLLLVKAYGWYSRGGSLALG